MASTGQSSAAAGDRDGAHYRVGADTHQAETDWSSREKSVKITSLQVQHRQEKKSAAAGTFRRRCGNMSDRKRVF